MHTQTRVLLGNTAYCNIHLVSIYNKQRRNSLDDRIFRCGAALRPSRIYVLAGNHSPHHEGNAPHSYRVTKADVFMLMVL